MACSSCAKKQAARGARLALSYQQRNKQRLERQLAAAQRKGDINKVNEITKRLNGTN